MPDALIRLMLRLALLGISRDELCAELFDGDRFLRGFFLFLTVGRS